MKLQVFSVHRLLPVVILCVFLLGTGVVYAQKTGGFTGPGPKIVTVEQAKDLRDDVKIVLQGYIIQSLGGDHYTFKDNSGTATLEIDHDKWLGQEVGPDDLVEISGEVDKGWTSFKIDVDHITKK